HINTQSKVTGHVGAAQLEEAIKDAAIVVIPAGVPRKPGMTRDDLFKINAGIVRDLAVAAAKYAPKAFMCIISNPVNSTVPIVAEVFKQFNVYDPRRIFGVTTLDIVRASTFVSELIGASASTLRVPVVGGHSGVTILPLLSQVEGTDKLSQEQIEQVTYRIQFGGDEVVKAKDGAGSATLSMAYAGARFALNIAEAVVAGKKGIVECTYIDLEADKEGVAKSYVGDLEYFSLPVELGPQGVERVLPLGQLNDYEHKLLAAATPELKGNIVKGATFITEAKL
ncbi:hypothetical protein CU098_007495, partial [Rhizopus stolonifer]